MVKGKSSKQLSCPLTQDEVLACLLCALCKVDDAGLDPNSHPGNSEYLRGIPEKPACWSEGSFVEKAKADF